MESASAFKTHKKKKRINEKKKKKYKKKKKKKSKIPMKWFSRLKMEIKSYYQS